MELDEKVAKVARHQLDGAMETSGFHSIYNAPPPPTSPRTRFVQHAPTTGTPTYARREGVAWAAMSYAGPRDVLPVGPGAAPNLQPGRRCVGCLVVTGTTGRTFCGTPERHRPSFHFPRNATACSALHLVVLCIPGRGAGRVWGFTFSQFLPFVTWQQWTVDTEAVFPGTSVRFTTTH